VRLPSARALATLRAGGLLRATDPLPPELELRTDSRAEIGGRTFLALRGERFDGNAHAAGAVARGAAAVVLDDPDAPHGDAPRLLVADGLRAYLALAELARTIARERGARVLAVTGSAGKTTTKEFLAQLLRASAGVAPERVAATPANENNEIGTAKLFTGLPEDAAYVVAEFGARKPHDIAPLVAVAAPEIAVLTNVGDAHLEIFGSREALLETKFEIATGAARLIACAADPASRARIGGDPTLADRVAWFAGCEADAPLPAAADLVVLRRRDDDRCELVVAAAGRVRTSLVACALPGAHNLANAAAALAAVRALRLGKAAEARAAEALARLVLPHGRYERGRAGVLETIFDAYNASPDGMLAALAAFAREPATRRIAVLASMAELGATAGAAHVRVGAAAAAIAPDVLLVGGAYAEDLAHGARDAGYPRERIVPFAENAAAAAWLRAHARLGDLVLFKGSRAYRLEDIVEDLRAVPF